MAYEHDTSTLGGMARHGYGLTAYCDARGCERHALDLDIYDLLIAFGARTRIERPMRWPIRCSSCGSNEISYRIAPETLPKETARLGPTWRFRDSRSEVEREALKVLFPRALD